MRATQAPGIGTGRPDVVLEIIRSAQIPKRILSANHFMFSHWRTYWHYKKSWHALLAVIFRSPGPAYIRPQRAVVRIVSTRKRTLDFDNLVNGVKPILDWLKVAGWIVDDDPEHLELLVSQERAQDDYTTVELLREKADGGSTHDAQVIGPQPLPAQESSKRLRVRVKAYTQE